MAEHRINVTVLTATEDLKVGDKVKLDVKISPSISLTSKKKAKATISCSLWDKPHKVSIHKHETFERTLVNAGTAPIEVTGLVDVTAGTLPSADLEVGAGAQIGFAAKPVADDRIGEPRTGTNPIQIGEVALQLELTGGPHPKGTQFKLTSPAFKSAVTHKLEKRQAAGTFAVPVKIAYAESSSPVTVTIEQVTRGEVIAGRDTVQITPVAPRASLVWKDPNDASKTFRSEESIFLAATLSYAWPHSLKADVRGPHVKGDKQSVSIPKDTDRHEFEVPLKALRDLQPGKKGVRLHKVSGDFMVDLDAHTVEVDAAPALEIGFADDGWIEPEPKGLTEGDTIKVTARLNQGAPATGSYGEVSVGGGAAKPLQFHEGSAPSDPVEFVLEKAGKKVKVEITPNKVGEVEPVAAKSATQTITVHQANRVLFGDRNPDPKPPFYGGDVVKIPVKLKYSLALSPDEQTQGVREKKVAVLKCDLFEQANGYDVVFEEGTDKGFVEVTFDDAKVTSQKKKEATLTLEPEEGFRAKDGGPRGSSSVANKKYAISPKRGLELVGKPFVRDADGTEHEIEFAFAKEKVCFRVKASSAVTEDSPAADLHIASNSKDVKYSTNVAVALSNGSDTTIVEWPADKPQRATKNFKDVKLKFKLVPKAGFKRTGDSDAKTKLAIRAFPSATFAEPPFVAPKGGAAPRQEGTAYAFAVGEEGQVRIQLDPDARPPVEGCKLKLKASHPVLKVKDPETGVLSNAAAEHALTELTTKRYLDLGNALLDVGVAFDAPQGNPTPNVTLSLIEVAPNQGNVQVPGPNTGTATVKVSTAPRIGFPAEGWLVRAGGGDPNAPLSHGEEITLVLELLGSKPTTAWQALLECAAFPVDLNAPDPPPGKPKPLPNVEVTFDPNASDAQQVWDSGKLEVKVKLETRTAEQPTVTLKAKPGVPAPPPPAKPVALGATSRSLNIRKSLNLKFAKLDSGKWTDPEGPFVAGDDVTVKLVLSEAPTTLQAGALLAKFSSLAFKPPPPKPGQPKPAPGSPPLPGKRNAELADPAETEQLVTFKIEQSPAERGEIEVALAEEPKSPFAPLPGKADTIRVLVYPLPTVSIAFDQPDFHATEPPPDPNAQPAL